MVEIRASLLIGILVSTLHITKVTSRHVESLPDAMGYLMQYGYLDLPISKPSPETKSANLLSQDAIQEYIREFQSFAGLAQTGRLDPDTVTMMNKPRCGVKDVVGHSARTKRYALQGSRWKVKNLTYRISKYPSSSKMSKKDVDYEIARALQVWADVTDLTFEPRKEGSVHIDIKFADGEHGDGDAFDGYGGTLAHAFFPVYGGDAHFDNAETWTMNTYLGTNLLQTAAHEFGHSLGLSHSDQNKALMSPFYRGYEKKVRLERDDISAITSLYGEKIDKPSPSVVFPGRNPDRGNTELCNDRGRGFDTIVTTDDRQTFVFKNNKYWRLTDDSIAPGYPRTISSDWRGLSRNLNAAFTWTNGKTYFFKKSMYWRFSNQTMDEGYPKRISSGFEGIPDDIDAAFVWSGNAKIYFFKGSNYWRFDPDQSPPVKSSYPRPISNWNGIPDNINAAMLYKNGFTYFFKENNYWRFNDRAFSIDDSDPAYPRDTSSWWFGCSVRSQPLILFPD